MAAIVRKKDEAVLKEKSLEEQLKFQKQVNYITNKIHGAMGPGIPTISCSTFRVRSWVFLTLIG
jgi:hypothetical protein